MKDEFALDLSAPKRLAKRPKRTIPHRWLIFHQDGASSSTQNLNVVGLPDLGSFPGQLSHISLA